MWIRGLEWGVVLTVGVLLYGAVGCTRDKKKAPKRTPPTGMQSTAMDVQPRLRPRPRAAGLADPRWPAGYKQVKAVEVQSTRLAQISQAVGASLKRVVNYHLLQGERPLQVNVFEAASEATAKQIYRRFWLRAGFGLRLKYAQRGRFVVELVSRDKDPPRWQRFQRSMGLLDQSVRRFRITARMGLLQSGSQAISNELLNLALRPRPAAAAWKRKWDERVRALRFGDAFRLRRAPTTGGSSSYRLSPRPVSVRPEGAVWRYELKAPPKLWGVPYVDVTADVSTRGWTVLSDPKEPGPALLSATKEWPTTAPEIQAVVRKVVTQGQSPVDRLAALHRWAIKHVRRGGAQGSRDGTLVVLKRGYGRCADQSDVLITLARAAGLPARMVVGWLVGGGGHYWAEVYVTGRGWVSVDATAPWLGVSGDYLPLAVSETGPLPVMHLRWPRIEQLR